MNTKIRLYKTFEQLITEKYVGQYIVLSPKYNKSAFCADLRYRKIISYNRNNKKLYYTDHLGDQWGIELETLKLELLSRYVRLSNYTTWGEEVDN
jgi:hypothetical protein